MQFNLGRVGLIALLLFTTFSAFSQSINLSGYLKDARTKEVLVAGTIELLEGERRITAASTDMNGRFRLSISKPGKYTIRASYVGYFNDEREENISASRELETIFLKPDVKLLKEVEVKDIQKRGEQRGDTTEINADAYKTNADANADELVKKMPGISIEGGTIKAQGENVTRLTVDGKEYFGDDVTLALKSLPAEVIDKVQVFDRLSDQAQFTGFNDGNTQKTMNITTKMDKRGGQFGNVYVGYGTENRYQAGLNLNYFSTKRRITLVGISNNINQQNFSSQDLMGLSGGAGARGMGPGRSMMPGGGGANPTDFMVGQQGGINTTTAFGINYTEDFGKRWKLQSSYFFNQMETDKQVKSDQQFFATESGNQQVLANETQDTRNFNHRVNARLEFKPDTNNTFIFTPRISLQENTGVFSTQSRTSQNENPLNLLLNRQNIDGISYQLNGDLLWMHKFAKPGRTISVNTGTNISNTNRNNLMTSVSEFYMLSDSIAGLRQNMETDDRSHTFSGRVDFSEKLSEKAQLMLTYNPSWRTNYRDQITNQEDVNAGGINTVDSLLSNNLVSRVNIQKIGPSIRFRNNKLFFMTGVFYQNTQLEVNQVMPSAYNLNRSYDNILPYAFGRITFDSQTNLRISYRTFTQVPTSSQLQPVLDNSNPLQLSTGNPDLDQQFSHTLMFRFSKANVARGKSYFGMASVTNTADYIGSQTIIAGPDTTTAAGYLLPPGSQLTRFTNLQGYWQGRLFNTWGMPVNPLKSNVNLNLEGAYTRTPGLINQQLNLSESWLLGTGAVLSSNISPEIDYTLGYTANFNWVFNSLQPQANQNFFNQNLTARLNYVYQEKWIFSTDATQTLFRGISTAINQQFLLWNASLAYKFLKNNRGELKATVFDILGSNTSIARNVTATFIQDTETNVLTRYFMLTFTYRIRNFKAASGAQETQPGNMPHGMPPGYRPGMPGGGMPPGGNPHMF